MIHFFGDLTTKVFAVQTTSEISIQSDQKLQWLFGNTPQIKQSAIADFFIGPRASMITPWSTNAVEITQNMGIEGIIRIEEFIPSTETKNDFDPMLLQKFSLLDQNIFNVSVTPEAIKDIHDIAAYNKSEGLALNKEEVARIYCDSIGTTRYTSARYASTDAADGSIVFSDIELVGFRYRTKLHRPAMRIALSSTPHGSGEPRAESTPF